jgi:tetratricopeptide (TPR) repeat protein
MKQSTPLDEQGLFKIGDEYLTQNQWASASLYFQHALQANPRNQRARLQLGQALLELGQIDEAVASLSLAYELGRQKGKSAYVSGLLSQAEASHKAGHEEGVLSACERVLEISPDEPKALARRTAIWTRRGDVALAKDDFSGALRAYREAGDSAKVTQVEALQRQQALAARETRAQAYAWAERWAEAHAIYQQLISIAPDAESRAVWERVLAHCQEELELASLFDEGVRAMQQEKWQQAQKALP